ncbi:N-acetylmuramoyl-L-alanine amidase [Sphaerisporangium sp. NPDC051011]|uniref:N-acetylmuramoyl-L-alanine amidase n=1 Tax=Sphaerisporangium sp. NPDC051011 TaxID=3155792 RepID=UPI0033CF530E
MARMPGADWRPIGTNFTDGGMGTILGVTLHIMAGTLAGTRAWFNNPRAEASSHFGTGKAGALDQYVDTADRAWAQARGNPNWISIENEGRGGDALTDAQLDRCAQVLAWAHKVHGVPLQVATSPTGRGLGHHAMGGAAWGGHSACPGPRIIAQKPEIVRRVKLIVAGTADPGITPAPTWTEALVNQLPLVKPGAKGPFSKRVFFLIIACGYGDGLDPEVMDPTVYAPRVVDAVKRLQADRKLDQDGIVGPKTWPELLGL